MTSELPSGIVAAAVAENVVDLMPWDIAVRSATQRREATELLERAQADEAIRGLSELEIYYAVKSLGLSDALPFLAVCEPEQIRGMIDLDVWHGERLAPDDLLAWLASFREVSLDRVQAAARALDDEVLATLFARRLHIWVRSPEEEEEHLPEWARSDEETVVETPDRRFLLAARAIDAADELEGGSKPIDEEERKAVLALVDDLYKDPDFEDVGGLLFQAQADVVSTLEDLALQFRTARLEDLGFPARSRALEIYGFVDPDKTLAEEPKKYRSHELRLPAIHAGRLSEGLLRAALREVADPERVRTIENDLVPLANAALVAEQVEPGDLEHLGEVLDRVRAYLELGLSYRAAPGERVQVARARLERLPIRAIFKVGWSLTLRAATRARAIASGRALRTAGDDLGLLDESDRSVIEALLAKRPMVSTAIDGAVPPLFRGWNSVEDLEKVDAALAGIEALAALAAAHGLGAANDALPPDVLPPEPIERSAELLLATMVARSLLGDPAAPRALDAAELLRLGASLAPERVKQALAELRVPGAIAARLEARMKDLATTLAAHEKEIDPRFVGEVLTRA